MLEILKLCCDLEVTKKSIGNVEAFKSDDVVNAPKRKISGTESITGIIKGLGGPVFMSKRGDWLLVRRVGEYNAVGMGPEEIAERIFGGSGEEISRLVLDACLALEAEELEYILRNDRPKRTELTQ